MKTINTTMAAILLATSATAGGLSNPIPYEEAPRVGTPTQSTSWGGAYAGLSFGQTTADTTRNVSEYDTVECGVKNCDVSVPDHLVGNADLNALADKDYSLSYGDADFNCGHMSYDCVTKRDGDGNATWVWLTEALEVETANYDVTDTDTTQGIGAFVGYRFQAGAAVYGVEASTDGTLSTAELSAGFAFGDVLVYGFGGAGQYDGEAGGVYGAGIDYRMTDRVTLGGKFTAGDFGSATTETAALRVAFNF